VEDSKQTNLQILVSGLSFLELKLPAASCESAIGGFDPQLVFLFFMVANPAASHGVSARWDSGFLPVFISIH